MIDRHMQLLLDCYLSGQIPADQWQATLKEDPEFAKFVASEMGPGFSTEPTLAVRERAFDAFYSGFKPLDHSSALDLAKAVFKAGWNARKQLDYEMALGVKR